MNGHTASLEITECVVLVVTETCVFRRVIENVIKYDLCVKFPQSLHTMYKYVLNLVVKISLMFAQYFDLLRHYTEGRRFFRGHGI